MYSLHKFDTNFPWTVTVSSMSFARALNSFYTSHEALILLEILCAITFSGNLLKNFANYFFQSDLQFSLVNRLIFLEFFELFLKYSKNYELHYKYVRTLNVDLNKRVRPENWDYIIVKEVVLFHSSRHVVMFPQS